MAVRQPPHNRVGGEVLGKWRAVRRPDSSVLLAEQVGPTRASAKILLVLVVFWYGLLAVMVGAGLGLVPGNWTPSEPGESPLDVRALAFPAVIGLWFVGAWFHAQYGVSQWAARRGEIAHGTGWSFRGLTREKSYRSGHFSIEERTHQTDGGACIPYLMLLFNPDHDLPQVFCQTFGAGTSTPDELLELATLLAGTTGWELVVSKAARAQLPRGHTPVRW